MLVANENQFTWGAIKSSYARFSLKMNEDQGLFLKFVLPIILASVAVPVSMWYANHQIALYFGFSDLGFINIALQMQVVMAFLPTIFNSMAIPILSKTFKESRIEFASYFKGLAFKTIASSGLIFMVIFVFSKQILFFYSPNFVAYSDILRVFSISFFLSVILNIIGVVILSVASMWWGTILNVIWALSYVAAILFFVPLYGLIGFAYSYLFSYGIHLVSVLIYTFYFFRKNT
jgi:O-antigen/teichoic acid export membrane protein